MCCNESLPQSARSCAIDMASYTRFSHTCTPGTHTLLLLAGRPFRAIYAVQTVLGSLQPSSFDSRKHQRPTSCHFDTINTMNCGHRPPRPLVWCEQRRLFRIANLRVSFGTAGLIRICGGRSRIALREACEERKGNEFILGSVGLLVSGPGTTCPASASARICDFSRIKTKM
ncbi:hypothetical protein BCV70DRAFT_123362 [Testicularia cyperi]|uniref:Uncharacterized protein n=1 Tax=Testicularia cyperi TaxID=1882483 RepID=A0A317XL79_9BASI|nr:hypothetical protein BCV70DRAFT_123362 [Testicularia cyperi]